MSDLLKYGLIGAGAYLLYKQFVAAPVVSTPTTTTPQTPVALTPAASIVLTLSATSANQIMTAAKNGGQLPASGLATPSVWNWYLNQVTGIAGPDLAPYLGYGGEPVPLSTYWAAVGQWAIDHLHAEQAAAHAAGVSGLSGLSCGGDLYGGLAGLGQTTRKVSAPAQPVGRYDFSEMGWG